MATIRQYECERAKPLASFTLVELLISMTILVLLHDLGYADCIGHCFNRLKHLTARIDILHR